MPKRKPYELNIIKKINEVIMDNMNKHKSTEMICFRAFDGVFKGYRMPVHIRSMYWH